MLTEAALEAAKTLGAAGLSEDTARRAYEIVSAEMRGPKGRGMRP